MLNRMWDHFKFLTPTVRAFLLGSFIIGFISAAAEYVFVALFQLFLIVLGLTKSDLLSIPDWVPTSTSFVMIGLIVAGIIRAAVQILKLYFSRMCAQKFSQDVRAQIVGFALNLGPRVSTSKAIALFSDIVNRAGQTLLNLCTILTAVVTAIAVISVAAVKAPLVVLVGVFFTGLSYWLLRGLIRRFSMSGTELSSHWQSVNLTLTEGIRNYFYLQLCGMVPKEIQRAEESLEKYQQSYRTYVLGSAIRQGIPLVLSAGLIVAMTVVGQQLAVAGSILVTVLYLYLRCLQNISEGYGAWNDLRINGSAFLEVRHMLAHFKLQSNSTMNSNVGNGRVSAPENWRLEISNLAFSYGERPIIDNLSVNLGAGDCWYISGESGVGKSTLLSLIAGYLTPQSGSIKISGRQLHEYDKSILDGMGYVGPTPYLVEGSIRDNLLYGHHRSGEISDAKMYEALHWVALSSWIEGLPQGLDAKIDEIGSALSTGQKSRLAIARTLLRSPKLIILDEATSNLDERTENSVLEAMRPVFKDAIVVLVSHRPHLARLATQTLKMMKSEIRLSPTKQGEINAATSN